MCFDRDTWGLLFSLCLDEATNANISNAIFSLKFYRTHNGEKQAISLEETPSKGEGRVYLTGRVCTHQRNDTEAHRCNISSGSRGRDGTECTIDAKPSCCGAWDEISACEVVSAAHDRCSESHKATKRSQRKTETKIIRVARRV